jgi:hypothetical protein
LTDSDGLGAVAVLAAAPYQLLERVTQVLTIAPHGLVAQMRSGPSVYFGDSAELAAKWTAAAAVLADPGSVGAVYVDVTDPARPAAGGVGPTVTTSTTPTPASVAPNGPTASAAGAGTPSQAAPAATTATTSGG